MPSEIYESYIDGSNYNPSTYNRLTYPNPFFDLSRHYYPKTVKSLLKSARIFFYQNEVVNNIIYKLSEYPITDIVIDDLDDSESKKSYERLLKHDLKLKSFMIEIGLDYFVYGNCFISANMKFERFLTCGHQDCQDTLPIKQVKYKFTNYQFSGMCAKCGRHTIYKQDERFLKSSGYLKFIRWNPESITIDYDELTGESKYYYTVNEKTRKGILAGKPEVIEKVPWIFVDAARNNSKIELDVKNLYHFKRPTLAEEDQGWGKSILLPVMKLLWYMQTMRRGNEAIISEHLIPMRVVFPQAMGSLDPFSTVNMGSWRSNVEDSLVRWRRDPNYVATFPLPIGYQALGGDAKMLMMVPELDYTQEAVINALGVPIEFIKGGSTWTSSSVSLRIVENHFLTYREQLEDFLNHFLADKIHALLEYPKVTLRMIKFKMLDDAEAKNQMLNLAQGGKISTSTLLSEFGYDLKEEMRAQGIEAKDMMDAQTQQLVAQAEAQRKVASINARAQAESQYAGQEAMFRIKERLFSEELVLELGVTDKDPSDILEKMSIQYFGIDIKDLQKMQKQSPNVFNFLVQRLQALGGLADASAEEEGNKEKKKSNG